MGGRDPGHQDPGKRVADGEFPVEPDEQRVLTPWTDQERILMHLHHIAIGVRPDPPHRARGCPPFPAGTALWDVIDAGRAAVNAAGERRVVLVVTDGADNCSASDIDAVRRGIEIDGVMVYGVGVRGREGLPTSEMRAITRATGGWYFELQAADDVGGAMQKIADELHRQYALGFSPAELDGRVHRLSVRTRQSGLTVRARRSYVARPNGRVP